MTARTPSEIVKSPADTPLDPENAVTRLGLVALATDLTIERDAARLIPPDGFALHVSRVEYANPTTPENLRRMAPRLAQAAALLVPGLPLAAICFGCTSASVAIGDDEVEAAVAAGRPGVPVVNPTRAAKWALAALGVGRIALLTPYLPETTRPMVEHFAGHGFEVVSARCLGLEDDRHMARVSHDAIIAEAVAADHPAAEAMFLSCTALPALGVVQALEQRLGKPVVTSNQASFWSMLNLARSPARPTGYGRLFEHPLPAGRSTAVGGEAG